MPIRKWLGRSKKCPGTAEVSYSMRRRVRKSSTLPWARRKMAVVPNSVRGVETASRLSRNSRSSARSASTIFLAHSRMDSRFSKRHDAQQFRGVGRDGREQVVQPPHGARQIGLCQNPSTAQAAQAVHFGQTAGDNELRAQMVTRLRRIGVNRVEIDFVDQHARAYTAREAADFAQRCFRSQDARSDCAGW